MRKPFLCFHRILLLIFLLSENMTSLCLKETASKLFNSVPRGVGVGNINSLVRMNLSSGDSAPKTPKRLSLSKDFNKKSPEQKADELERGRRCIKFIDASPEPFHCVFTVKSNLLKEGFIELDEADPNWRNIIKLGGKYFYTRNGSSIVAFIVGNRYKDGNGFKIIGAHTDSPNLKLKPKTKRSSTGLIQLNVESYGGGLWHTWFDRDLSLAGRVIVRDAEGSFAHRLVRIDRPLLRIPNLCIHLRSPDERESFKVNKEDHLIPILCDEVKKALTKDDGKEESKGKEDKEDDEEDEEGLEDVWKEAQEPTLLELLATELDCTQEEILDFELSLFDTQGAALSGFRSEYLVGSRIDNLASCFVAIEALISHGHRQDNHDDTDDTADDAVSIVALFDHEEVGSGSYAGAGSNLIEESLNRISTVLASSDPVELLENRHAALAKSFIMSVDMAHAVHPNYASKHEKTHSPMMNRGVVIKTNSNQRYATSGVTGFMVRELARASACGVPIQEFAVRNDCPCGSTIGPTLSAQTGIMAVDLGMPQLSMHSIREMMGVNDLLFGFRLFDSFLKDFGKVQSQMNKKN